jgi:hypothetical protein
LARRVCLPALWFDCKRLAGAVLARLDGAVIALDMDIKIYVYAYAQN